MSTEPRPVTLATSDRGPVTIPEPAWCAGHPHHDPETLHADIVHSGPEIALTFRHLTLLSASLGQAPHGTSTTPGMDGPTPGISVHPLGETLAPVDVYDLAAALDGYADRLRDLADQLTAVLAGGAE